MKEMKEMKMITTKEIKKCFYLSNEVLIFKGIIFNFIKDFSQKKGILMEETFLCFNEQVLGSYSKKDALNILSEMRTKYSEVGMINAWKHFGRNGIHSFSLRSLKNGGYNDRYK